jgi:hypothetical protein
LVALLLQREHVVGPAADIERVVAAEHHLAGAVELIGQDFDMEARQQLDVVFDQPHQLVMGRRQRLPRIGMGAVLLRRLVAHEPVCGRVLPVIAAVAVVLDQRFVGAGRAG